jgi:hypothetical protein
MVSAGCDSGLDDACCDRSLNSTLPSQQQRRYTAVARSAMGLVCTAMPLHSSGQECAGSSVPSNGSGRGNSPSSHLCADELSDGPKPKLMGCHAPAPHSPCCCAMRLPLTYHAAMPHVVVEHKLATRKFETKKHELGHGCTCRMLTWSAEGVCDLDLGMGCTFRLGLGLACAHMSKTTRHRTHRKLQVSVWCCW